MNLPSVLDFIAFSVEPTGIFLQQVVQKSPLTVTPSCVAIVEVTFSKDEKGAVEEIHADFSNMAGKTVTYQNPGLNTEGRPEIYVDGDLIDDIEHSPRVLAAFNLETLAKLIDQLNLHCGVGVRLVNHEDGICVNIETGPPRLNANPLLRVAA